MVAEGDAQKTFKFCELSPEAQEQAVRDQLSVYLKTTAHEQLGDNALRAVREAVAKGDRALLPALLYERCREEVEQVIQDLDPDFTAEGRFTAPVFGLTGLTLNEAWPKNIECTDSTGTDLSIAVSDLLERFDTVLLQRVL